LWGLLDEQGDQYALRGPLPPLAIPTTLQDSLTARLDGLESAKAVAQYASVIGRQFSYALLRVVSSLDEATLQHELDRLVAAELLYQRGLSPQATYTFKHALIQDSAYQSLLRSTKQKYHQHIAEVLETRFPETVATQPELLAFHYTEAGCIEQAVSYWYQAGQRVISAHREAIAHLSKGLELLQTLPYSSERIRRELDLQVAIGSALTANKGQAASEVAEVYNRARVLCEQIEDAPQLFPTLHGLYRFRFTRAEHQAGRELGEQLLHLAQRQQHSVPILAARVARGSSLYALGEFPAAQHHLQQGATFYDPDQHHELVSLYATDTGVICRFCLTWVSWLMGYREQALRIGTDTLMLARGFSYPLNLAFALCYASVFYQYRRDRQAVQTLAGEAMTLCAQHGDLELRRKEKITRSFGRNKVIFDFYVWNLALLREVEAKVDKRECGELGSCYGTLF
jgi:hypothetical protein